MFMFNVVNQPAFDAVIGEGNGNKRKFMLPLDLQTFAEGGEGGEGGGGGEGGEQGGGQGGSNKGDGSGGQGGNAGGQGSGGQGGGEQKPFAVFPDEASFTARLSREAKKHLGDFLKGLGFEKEDDLKTIVQSHRENEEKSKTDLQREKEARTNAEKSATDAIALMNTTLLNAEAKVAAMGLGIKPERIGYALKLADLAGVEVKDGTVDTTALNEALNKVLTDMPELKGTTVPDKGGQDFPGGGQGGGGSLLTWEAINAMSTKEAEARMPEIMAFMEKNQRR